MKRTKFLKHDSGLYAEEVAAGKKGIVKSLKMSELPNRSFLRKQFL